MDASVLAALVFDEEGSSAAVRFVAEQVQNDVRLSAPDLLALEMASIAAKKVWRGLASFADGEAAIQSVQQLIETLTPVGDLSHRAYVLAAQHRFSAYDATYLALAEMKACAMATLDGKLVQRAHDCGLGHLVHAVT